MAHVYLPPPDHREMIDFLIARFREYRIYVGDNRSFYETDDLGSRPVPVNHVRCNLAKDLHANFFVTTKVRAFIVAKVIEAIFKWAEDKGKRIND